MHCGVQKIHTKNYRNTVIGKLQILRLPTIPDLLILRRMLCAPIRNFKSVHQKLHLYTYITAQKNNIIILLVDPNTTVIVFSDVLILDVAYATKSVYRKSRNHNRPQVKTMCFTIAVGRCRHLRTVSNEYSVIGSCPPAIDSASTL